MSDATALGALRVLDRDADLPAADIEPTPEAWLRSLASPALIRVEGRDPARARVVATLLHGNEPSGLRALHAWLRTGRRPAVTTWLFIGAVRAALVPPGFDRRLLVGGQDLNRCWLPPYEGEAGALAERVLRHLRDAAPEALLDVHNNTGHNPPYAVAPRAGRAELNLLRPFGSRFVHSDLCLGALVEAAAPICPSVTIECGRAGDPAADVVALRGIEIFLESDDLALSSPPGEPVEVLTEPIRVSVREGVKLAFGSRAAPGAALTVSEDIDRHNFEWIGAGTPIGWVASPEPWPLVAIHPDGSDRSRALFGVRDGVLETRQPILPIMMTTDATNATLDCLFYVVRPRGGAPDA